MKHFLAVVLFAVIAGLVSCEVASRDGIRGIPAAISKLRSGVPVVAKIEASAIDAADAVAVAKAKVVDVAEKAVEAAQPDRSDAVTPYPDDAALLAAADAPNEAAADPAPALSPSGVTQFYGRHAGTAVAAWSAEAVMNPDYGSETAAVQEMAQVDAADEPIAPAAEPAAEAPAVEPVVEPQPETVAADGPAPVSLGGVGQTSYFGLAEKPDSERPWAAAATVFADAVAVDTPATETSPIAEETPATAETPAAVEAEPAVAAEEAAPVSLGGVGQTSYFGLADKPDSDQPWAASAAMNPDYTPSASAEAEPAEPAEPVVETAPAAAAEPAAPAAEDVAATVQDDAPASLGGVGQTSFFGLASMPDADRPWAVEATMNPDYSAEAPVEQAPVAETEIEATPADEVPPVSLGGIGQTSYFGIAEKPDSSQPWAAAAAGNPDYTTAIAMPPETPPATPQAVDACRVALNAEAQSGGLNFGLTRWDITLENYGSLDKLAKLAKDCGGVRIEVHGHTDNTGRPASNQTLSELRAKAVVTYLTKAGVPLSKLKAVGFGQDKPVGDNATAEGRHQNRRIEFVVTGN